MNKEETINELERENKRLLEENNLLKKDNTLIKQEFNLFLDDGLDDFETEDIDYNALRLM